MSLTVIIIVASHMLKAKLNTEGTPYWFRHTFSYELKRLKVDSDIRWDLLNKQGKDSRDFYDHKVYE
ncbi:MAG: hypothetical protein GY870_01000, partial [archaeon]|nr:hypothetical protein [archaeon]